MKIYLGFGANKPTKSLSPTGSIETAIERLQAKGLTFVARSSLYQSQSLLAGQSPYVNMVALFHASRTANSILALCKQVERDLGRRGKHAPWGPRTMDIDLLAMGPLIIGWHHGDQFAGPVSKRPLMVPHPQMHLRHFVLEPLHEIAPNWRHPVFHRRAKELLVKYGTNQQLDLVEKG